MLPLVLVGEGWEDWCSGGVGGGVGGGRVGSGVGSGGTQAVANPSVLARQFPDNINYG